ncbi:MAG: DUF3108 domain-containing protein [Hyphomicrobiaceae bacterium]|uniref:DUF3108 domain-containing protein n=1 Tax=Zhengella mangrovi TaxID=1982044 RepID=A0A2G1QJ35_9HYPH|nr:DUF3108 domain-containing protein [Zhengella mangrovi]MCB1512598.1 DUF3108 domain-containing protein [Hyphomicrobiaceae bacterium]PHP65533.1 hypothetical protein CSC94_18210 [Zhengella mangrovi]
MRHLRTILFATAMAATPAAAQALEAGPAFVTEYRISILGLPLGVSHFESRVDGDRFTVEGTVRSAGIARIFDKTVANSRVEGRMTDEGVQPTSYALNYVSGKKKRAAELVFRNGNVVETRLSPKPRKNDRLVPVGPQHLTAVSDPLTASIVRAGSPEAVCARTLHVFDGQMRMDIALSAPQVGKVRLAGYSGPAVTCKAKFTPVAGYRKGKKSIEFLRTNNNISVTFARRGSTDVYAPVKASVPTYIGTLTIAATRFGPAD